jgi:uncharacterized protein YdcH (DUF465 family)
MEKIRVDVNSAAVEMVQLRERHGEIERRLAELDRHLSLTPDEQLERARLKKEKLRAKDRLALLAAHPPTSASATSPSAGAPPGPRLRV